MPGELLSLRLLSSSVSSNGFSSSMKLGPNFRSSRGISVFSRVFPFKLKYTSLSRNLGLPVSMTTSESGARKFSTGSFRGGGRSNGVSRNSGFSRGGRGGGRLDRGEFEGGNRGGQGKSLIEDEAELSDWISELKTDSIRVGLNSDSDGSDGDNGRNRDRGDGGRGRGRGRGSFSSSRGGGGEGLKRRRESNSNDFSSFRGGNGSGTGAGSFSKNSRGSMSGSRRRLPSDSDVDEVRESFPRRREFGSRGGAVSSPANRGGRNSHFNNGQSRGGGAMQRREKDFGVPTRRKSFDDDSGDEDDVELSGRVKSSSKQALQISDDEDEDEDEDDDDEDADDDEDEDEDEDKDVLSSLRGRLIGKDSEDSDKNAFEDILHKSAKGNISQAKPKVSTGETASYLSQTRFDQCIVSPLSLKGIKDAGYEHMTVVQEATLPVILKGKDVLAKAKTGTGKTVAFLLPAIEAVVKSRSVDRDQKRPPINVLVICPTRELANQAAAEASKLLKYHPYIGVQVVIGGVRLAMEQKRLQANPCQILIATPGRLRDHTENTAGFATRLMGVKVLVLDEADHLLDMGFRKDIEKNIAAVPKQRQTLLFSATVPEEVRQICHIALKRDHEYINTVEEGSEETHSQVRQMHLVAPLDKHFSLLYALLNKHISDDVDFKVLVFCTTAMVTRLVANLLSELNLNVREIHSRKPQSYRTRVSDEFRKSKGLILVTSDVSARGVDYPDVTLVIQVGLPSDREQYIHRLGRTGRKGKEGEGVLLLAPWEEFFLSSLRDLPLTKASVPSVDPETRKKVERALSQVEMKNKEAAYQAWLGFYNSNKTVARDKCRLVELANEFSRSMGLDNPPAIPKLVLGKMGLKNIPGLRTK